MKKIKILLAAVAAVFSLAACDMGGNEYHSTYFYPPTNGIVTYADQTYDTIRVVSSDSWTLASTADWCHIAYNGKFTPLSVTVQEGTLLAAKLEFNLRPNDTGVMRSLPIDVVSSYGKIGTVSQTLIQAPFINVTTPQPVKESGSDGKTRYTFTLNVPANGLMTASKQPTIEFTPYSAGATLSVDADWVKLDKATGFLAAKPQVVTLTVQANTASTERTATIKLTSNGITTPITVKQAAAK